MLLDGGISKLSSTCSSTVKTLFVTRWLKVNSCSRECNDVVLLLVPFLPPKGFISLDEGRVVKDARLRSEGSPFLNHDDLDFLSFLVSPSILVPWSEWDAIKSDFLLKMLVPWSEWVVIEFDLLLRIIWLSLDKLWTEKILYLPNHVMKAFFIEQRSDDAANQEVRGDSTE